MFTNFLIGRRVLLLAGVLLSSLMLQLFCSSGAYAVLEPISSKIIADSPEPFDRRIYSYDMGIDSSGNVHIVYSAPYSDTYANIYYVRRANGVWQSQSLLTANGVRGSISTHLIIGDDDRVHVCYNKNEGGGQYLIYRMINEGVIGSEVQVDQGGWHTRMQLDGNGYPVFVRDNQTWPGLVSKLALLSTDDGASWTKSYLNLTQVPEFRIADFLYVNGKYHITYGGSEYTKEVWSSKYETERVDRIFNDFHYAVSEDGITWDEIEIDSSGTLHEREYWTSIANDGNKILVCMYKYAEVTGCWNCGTSAILVTIDGLSWTKKTITNQEYVDTNEGAGNGIAVNGSGDYFGVWDFSPDYPQILPPAPRGNTAIRRSGPKNDWSHVEQLDDFSLEGKVRLRIHGGKLFYLALGDYTDTKLYFREYSIAELNKVLPPPGGIVQPGNSEVPLSTIYYMLLNDSPPSPPSGLEIK